MGRKLVRVMWRDRDDLLGAGMGLSLCGSAVSVKNLLIYSVIVPVVSNFNRAITKWCSVQM